MRVAREGWPFVAGFFILGAGGLVAAQVLGGPPWAVLAAASPGIGLGIFSLWFFRDPDREVPSGDGVVVSPADGRVVALSDGPEGPSIAIFLNVFDVHVNRAPVGGVVTHVDYRTGRYLPAFDGRAGDENEQNELVIESPAGSVRVRQIAGLIARRIVCRARPGDRVAAGERFGLIRFGSRTDLRLPLGSSLTVGIGDRVRGGATIVGRMPVAEVADPVHLSAAGRDGP